MKLSEILNKARESKEITAEEALFLFQQEPPLREEIFSVADEINTRINRNVVTFISNRNVNFTNICAIRCEFCAFRRTRDDSDAFTLSVEDVLERIGRTDNITEVCIQGGLNPDLSIDYYRELLQRISSSFPQIHIHAFSPMEIHYLAKREDISAREVLESFHQWGLGSLCGTAAEILVDDVRRKICPQKLSTEEWIGVVRAAHSLGIRSSATIMFGHIETRKQICEHLDVIRKLQAETGGFTEFIPLPFVPYKTSLGRESHIDEMIHYQEVFALYAISRIFFQNYIDNIQTSWAKLGLDRAVESLSIGINDLSGTLLEENITKSAGGTYGEALTIDDLRNAIIGAGKISKQRDTLYKILTKSDVGYLQSA